MAQSSLLGISRAPTDPAGRDTASLGPSDTSDTGSDVAGIDDLDDLDPGQPLDAALDPDVERPLMPGETLGVGGGSDAAGTGERRAAGSDAGLADGSDISVDRIIDPLREDADHDDEDPDLGFVDAEAGDPLENEVTGDEDPDDLRRARHDAVEDEAADPVGDGRSDARLAAAQPPVPGRSGPVDPDDLGEDDESDEAGVLDDDADDDEVDTGGGTRPGRG